MTHKEKAEAFWNELEADGVSRKQKVKEEAIGYGITAIVAFVACLVANAIFDL